MLYNMLVTSGLRPSQRAVGHNADAQLAAHRHQIALRVPAVDSVTRVDYHA
jgi:hypothetical protein